MLDEDLNDQNDDSSTDGPPETDDARPRRRRAASRPAGAPAAPLTDPFAASESAEPQDVVASAEVVAPAVSVTAVALFQPPPDVPALPAKREEDLTDDAEESDEQGESTADDEDGAPRKRRRRRGGRKRKKPTAADTDEDADDDDDAEADDESDGATDEDGSPTKRRRRRRRAGSNSDGGTDDPPNTVVHVRESRDANDMVSSVRGSTRLEAKKQRRREGREAGRRRPPILTESEFLARRESVDRVMVVRQRGELTQIGVLEDGVLAEHYVSRTQSSSMVGNVYLGRVQNVLPSMEAAFVDIGRGRNAVLYAGEVNWDAAGLEGQPKRIELALKTGDSVLVQVTKDPVGHKGARLTSQVSLPGRYLVYVPGGSMTGISRRLPDRERSRLKKVLKAVLPADAGVIVRTAAEGASAEQIERDVARLQAQWEELSAKTESVKAPQLLHSEPDLAVRVVRDIFNEDFKTLEVQGDSAATKITEYVDAVSPDLADRVRKWTANEDIFTAHRIDEQLSKALDRKVWLPSGGSLVIDHTEAMTVVDVNTGKFTGQGGNLEETVTRNNLEAAEEIVRQLRLRDTGGIIVVDFIDMVLESNRDLVLRRLLECLGRDRTKHQVAEVTSLGLVQMTRKRIGQGLLETFSETCDCCGGRGVKVHLEPVDKGTPEEQPARRRRRPAGPIPGAPQVKSESDDAQKGEESSSDAPAAESDPAEAAPEPAETDSREPESAETEYSETESSETAELVLGDADNSDEAHTSQDEGGTGAGQ